MTANAVPLRRATKGPQTQMMIRWRLVAREARRAAARWVAGAHMLAVCMWGCVMGCRLGCRLSTLTRKHACTVLGGHDMLARASWGSCASLHSGSCLKWHPLVADIEQAVRNMTAE